MSNFDEHTKAVYTFAFKCNARGKDPLLIARDTIVLMATGAKTGGEGCSFVKELQYGGYLNNDEGLLGRIADAQDYLHANFAEYLNGARAEITPIFKTKDGEEKCIGVSYKGFNPTING